MNTSWWIGTLDRLSEDMDREESVLWMDSHAEETATTIEAGCPEGITTPFFSSCILGDCIVT